MESIVKIYYFSVLMVYILYASFSVSSLCNSQDLCVHTDRQAD